MKVSCNFNLNADIDIERILIKLAVMLIVSILL